MSQDKYTFFGEDFPAIDWFDISPSDSDNIERDGNEVIPRAVYVGTGGNLVIVSDKGNTVTLLNIPDGTILPIQPIQIENTNTTAGDLVGLI